MAEKTVMARLTKGADLLEELTRIARENGVVKGSVAVIGALERAELGFYLQKEKKYVSHKVEENVEILAGLGNVSLKDGETFVHLHLTLSNLAGECTGGHAMPGCVLFAAEAVLREVGGEPLTRKPDGPTGLLLWA